jgi:hypothetical protein
VVHFLTNGLLPQFTKGLFGTTHRAAFDEAMPNGDFRNGFSTKGQWVNELGTVPKKGNLSRLLPLPMVKW